MPPTLDDTWARVEWAHRQLIRLDELVLPFLRSDPYLVRDEVNSEGTEQVISAEQPQPVPADVPFVFGDLVHSLHSALDYVVCSLVESVGQPIAKSHAFPIFDTPGQFGLHAPNMLRHVPNEAVKFIESMQPYQYVGGAQEQAPTVDHAPAFVERMPLMRLYRLSIEEKHHSLLLTTSVMSLAGTYIGHNRVGQEPGGIGFRVSPTHDKVQFVIRLDPANPNEHFDKRFAAKVSLVKEGPDGMAIENLARMLYNEVAHHVLAGIRRLNLIPLSRPRDLPFVD